MVTINDTVNSNTISFEEKDFAGLYHFAREKEGRMYTDEQVAQLPLITTLHPHYKEWRLRKRSAIRLLNYLKNKKRPLSVLEIGCGNGWLSARLSAIKNALVTATDINSTELEQAKRVFGKRLNIFFVRENINSIFFEHQKYDIIIFAASIQYFSAFEDTINAMRMLLKPGGEIHIIDSFFYKVNELGEAKMRSEQYFKTMGVAPLSKFYFHHSADSLKEFKHTYLFDPRNFLHKIFNRTAAFPWIRITN